MNIDDLIVKVFKKEFINFFWCEKGLFFVIGVRVFNIWRFKWGGKRGGYLDYIVSDKYDNVDDLLWIK